MSAEVWLLLGINIGAVIGAVVSRIIHQRELAATSNAIPSQDQIDELRKAVAEMRESTERTHRILNKRMEES